MEAVCVILNLPNPVTVCTVYVPPNSTATYYETLFDFLSNLSNASDQLIILGDFNFPDIDWDSLSSHSLPSNQFCDLVFQTGLSQLIDIPTHNHGNILDLVLTNLDDNIPIYKSIQLHYYHMITSTLPFCCLQVLQCLLSRPLTLHLVIPKVTTKAYMTTYVALTLHHAIQVMTLSIYGTLLNIR